MSHVSRGKRVRRVRAALPPQPPMSRKRRLGLAIFAMIVLVVLAIFIGAPVLSSYDQSHLEPMECTVTSAQIAGDRFGSNYVKIETTDCGQLGFGVGVNDANRDGIAAKINMGGKFVFEIGAGSRWMLEFYKATNFIPNVYSFKKL